MSSLEEFLTEDPVNYYCNVNSTQMCRLCLEKQPDTKKNCDIFDGAESLSTMIMACASVQILQGDGLPNTICQKCFSKLTEAWQFKLQCESSDSRLRQLYTNSNILQDIAGATDYISEEKDKIENGRFEFQHSSFDNLGEIQDPVEEFLENVNSEKATKNMEIQRKLNSKSTKMRKIDNTNQPKEAKIHQCDTCGKIFNRREYLTQHIRIHTGEKPYCCHICDKRFINSGHLSTHMRTHTGERPHACSLCPKTFSTKQELRKHTMVHNGERPFICTSCGKCFGSSSNLYSHLKHHTGEKNFTCEHCGKAFYTKQELKQHLVIHTGEKPFCCQYCNKRFSQSAHLRRHLKLHA